MVTAAEAFGTRLTEGRIRIYAQLLGDISYEQLRVAFGRAVRERTSTFFPTVGELRAYVGPTEPDAALLAWSALSRAAGDVGAYSAIVVEDGAAAAALVDVFGSWPGFCETEEGPGLALKRQEFLAAYRQARRAGPVKARELPGLGDPQDKASHVWRGRISLAGSVSTERADRQLEGHVATALPESTQRHPTAAETQARSGRNDRQDEGESPSGKA